MSPVAAAAVDKRFRRAHVKPARRRAGWRAFAKPVVKILALALVSGYALYRGASMALHARMLTVDRIAVSGNERLSKGEVVAVLSGLRGESLLFTDLDAWRRRLLASPWVKEAALRRALPSTIEVAILERQPVGVARFNGELYLVDERGVLIDQYGPQYADLDLPIIDGLSGGLSGTDANSGSVDEARADLAARVVTAVRSKPALAKRLSQVDVSDGHNATVILTGDPAVLELGDDQFVVRLESYLSLAPALRERVADIDYVDLRFDDRIYVRPTHVDKKPAAQASRPARGRP
jgi:cell division protein FtsQ